MKVMIVDDYPVVRRGLISIHSQESSVEELYEAASLEEALETLQEEDIYIAIVGLKLGKENGLALIRDSREHGLTTKFIVLASMDDKTDFGRVQEVGVEGYILKGAQIEDILYAFHVVSRGKRFFDSDILEQSSSTSGGNLLNRLTEREKEVLLELGKGLSNTQISSDLYISESTVKKHVSSILSKLGVTQRIEAALFVNRQGGLHAETSFGSFNLALK